MEMTVYADVKYLKGHETCDTKYLSVYGISTMIIKLSHLSLEWK